MDNPMLAGRLAQAALAAEQLTPNFPYLLWAKWHTEKQSKWRFQEFKKTIYLVMFYKSICFPVFSATVH